MTSLRRTKLLCATLLVCAGAVCVTLGDTARGNVAGVWIGVGLLAVGGPMLVRQWTGKGVFVHAAAALLWLWGTRTDAPSAVLSRGRPRPEPTGDA